MLEDDKLNELVWKLFEKSGNISYYLLHSKISDKQKKEDNKWKLR